MDNEEIKFNRKSDLENLNKIPKIETTLDFISLSLQELKNNLKDYPTTRQDVHWLKKFFFIIAGSSISAIILAVMSLILKK